MNLVRLISILYIQIQRCILQRVTNVNLVMFGTIMIIEKGKGVNIAYVCMGPTTTNGEYFWVSKKKATLNNLVKT